MHLHWQENTIQSNTGSQQHQHVSQYLGDTDQSIKAALGQCVEKAAELLPVNIQDDSLFLLFEWNKEHSQLNIVVSDADKNQDSPHLVRCDFTGLQNPAAYQEKVSYWLTDYLTTCAAFMNFSLVAAFYVNNRQESTLL